MKNHLILTVGLPRSGKSTWSSYLVKTYGYGIVNPDSIRLALYRRPYIVDAEEMVWTIAKIMVKSLFLTGYETVILDSTNMTRKARDRWASDDWTRGYKYFNTDVATCLERADQSAIDEEHREGLCGAIKRMNEEYEPVNEEEEGISS